MRTRETELQVISVLLDLLILNLAIVVLSWLEVGFFFIRPLDLYICLLQANFSWVLAYAFVTKKVLYIHKGFRFRLKRISLRMLTFIIIEILVYLPTSSVIPDLWIFIFQYSMLFYGFKLVSSFWYYKQVYKRRARSMTVKRTLLMGSHPNIHKLRQIIEANPVLKFTFVGYISDENSNSKILGTCDRFEEIVIQHNIEAVFTPVNNDEAIEMGCKQKELLKTCNRLGVRLYYVPVEIFDEQTLPLTQTSLDSLKVINPQQIPMDLIENQIKKRIFDLVFSGFIILFVLSWLYPIIALLIKLDSKGPVLFVQKRTGINKKDFNCYKFRSMKVNGDADNKQATKDDDRITKMGKFFRKTNIDELPQFLNVVKGEMSVVGPRPHMLKHTDEYSKLVEYYLVRHYVKPGITGWAQVNGLRGETDELWKMKRRVDYDMEYVQDWSFEWDLEIVWKTVFSLKSFMNAG